MFHKNDQVLFFYQLNKNQIAINSSRGSSIIFLPIQLIKPKFQPIENAKFQIFT